MLPPPADAAPAPMPGHAPRRRWWLWIGCAALFLAAWPGVVGLHLRRQRQEETRAGHAGADAHLSKEKGHLVVFDVLIVAGVACLLKANLGGHRADA